MNTYRRCHFINSENNVQCESWFASHDNSGNLCPVHIGFVGTTLASNGINKAEYIDARHVAEKSLREKLIGLDAQQSCNLLDAHISSIERIIEEQKTLSLTARAIRSEVIEGMSETDRQARRLMRVPKSERVEKAPRIKGTPEEMLSAFMKKYPSMTLEGAREMLGLD